MVSKHRPTATQAATRSRSLLSALLRFGHAPALWAIVLGAVSSIEAAAARASSEHSETTWSARTWMTFVVQRISVAVQLSLAQEVAEALGLSVAADPRAR